MEALQASRLPSTCEWICEQVHFQRWLAGSSPFICLMGAAGSGKSHLASKIIDVLRDRYSSNNGLSKDKPATPLIGYCFCRSPDNIRRKLLDGLRGMIGQLVEQDRKFGKELSEFFHEDSSRGNNLTPTIPWLFNTILARSKVLLKKPAVFMVVDGLDECDEKERQIFLKCAYQLCVPRSATFRIFCSGRPEIKSELSEVVALETQQSFEVPTIEITWQTKPDIDKLIKARMRRMRFFQNQRLRFKIYHSITNSSNGLFLWTDLTLKEFQKARTEDDVFRTLENMSETRNLDNLYDRIISSLLDHARPTQTQISTELMKWIVFGSEPFTYFELREAIRLSLNTMVFSLSEELERWGSIIDIRAFQRVRLANDYAMVISPSEEDWNEFDLDESIDKSTLWDDGSGLIGNEVIQIRHTTFLDYLHRKSAQLLIVVDANDAHLQIGLVCTKIITESKEGPNPHNSVLLDYALTNWCGHFSKVSVSATNSRHILSQVKALFTDWAIAKVWLIKGITKYVLQLREFILDHVPGMMKCLLSDKEDGDPLSRWTYNLDITRRDIGGVLFDQLIQSAESHDFFSKLPRIEKCEQYSKVMESLLWLKEFVSPPILSLQS
jgi:hypothetical protein